MVPQTIWKRRVALLVVIAFVVGVPLTLLVRADDEEGPGLTLTPANLEKEKTSGPLKVDFRLPKRGWRSETENDTLKLRSRDRSALIVIAAPAPTGRRDRVLADLLAEIRSQYRAVKVRPAGGKVANLNAKGAAVSAKSKKGTKLQIIVTTVNARKRTYVIELFLSDAADPDRVAEGRAILSSLRIRG